MAHQGCFHHADILANVHMAKCVSFVAACAKGRKLNLLVNATFLRRWRVPAVVVEVRPPVFWAQGATRVEACG